METAQFSRDEVVRLLTATGTEQQELFERARAARRQHCGDRVLLRGLVEISNYCQKKCDYCAMRAPNKGLDRYRLTAEEILTIVAEIKRHIIEDQEKRKAYFHRFVFSQKFAQVDPWSERVSGKDKHESRPLASVGFAEAAE